MDREEYFGKGMHAGLVFKGLSAWKLCTVLLIQVSVGSRMTNCLLSHSRMIMMARSSPIRRTRWVGSLDSDGKKRGVQCL